MAGQRQEDGRTDEGEGTGKVVKRRGILAVAGAVIAGIVAKQTSQKTAANDSVWQWPYKGTTATVSGGSAMNITNTSANSDGIFVSAMREGIISHGDDIGVLGSTGFTGIGVRGDGGSVVGTGVEGRGGGDNSANTTGFPIGVRGSVPTNGYGVYGNAGNGYGVYGNATGGIGVGGVAAGGYGVKGISASGTGEAAFHNAASGSGQGVYGSSNSPDGFGIVGANNAAGGTGLLGYIAGPGTGAIAFAGTASPGNYAAYFNGTVVVNGQLIVSDPSYKSGVLKHSVDGSDRLVYCMESPESWIEDFGTGKLVNGQASVNLDPDFAAVVRTDDYHVFLMERDGTHHHLSVDKQGASGFTVTADAEGARVKGKQASDLSGTFSYRVVARPKTEKKLQRLAKFAMPKAPKIAAASFPKAAPEPPNKP